MHAKSSTQTTKLLTVTALAHHQPFLAQATKLTYDRESKTLPATPYAWQRGTPALGDTRNLEQRPGCVLA